MPRNLDHRKLLFLASLFAALISGGCLGGSNNPKPHVIRSKVAKTPPPAPAAAPAPATAASTDNKPAVASAPASKAPPKPDIVKPDKEKAKADSGEDTTASAEPDKLLYERSMTDIKKGRYTEARLSLQALINTYPDSEYLAKAKLAVGDSFYKEGGTSNLTQAVEEYRNFIIFFPFLDEASYAQLQVGMAHYHMMEKSDRDNTNAQAAEDDYQTFLLKYPTSPLVPQAEQRLRDVQEVLADGEYKIARFYYIKQDYAASAARLIEVADRYPLYSQSDEAVWMLGDVYDRARQASKNEDNKNHFADLEAKCYDRILTDYPLSKHAAEAQARLKSMGMTVPAADPNAIARMQKQQTFEKSHRENALVRFPKGILHTGADVSTAARSGAPNLSPPTDAISAIDVLKPGAEGPTFSMGPQPTSADQNNNADASSSGGTEEAARGASEDTAGTGVSVQIVSPPDATSAAAGSSGSVAGGTPASNPPATTSTDTNATDNNGVPLLVPSTAVSPTPAASNPSTPPATTSSVTDGTTPAAPANATPATPTNTGSAPAPGSAPASSGTQQQPASGQPSAASQNGAKTDAKADTKTDDKSESSSKKKKGLKKIIPW